MFREQEWVSPEPRSELVRKAARLSDPSFVERSALISEQRSTRSDLLTMVYTRLLPFALIVDGSQETADCVSLEYFLNIDA